MKRTLLRTAWWPSLACLLTSGAFVALADDNLTSWEHAPSGYVAPQGLVRGGAFIDRILPMPISQPLRADVWGGDNVKPRNVANGLEDPDWSYWCMDVFPANGKEHMFAVRWPEDAPKGHMTWPQSRVVHAVADQPTGPFKALQDIGPGHNVMCYRAKDGTYVLYVIDGAYTSRTLDGPWQRYDLQYDLRGTAKVPMSNHAFAQREDGSYARLPDHRAAVPILSQQGANLSMPAGLSVIVENFGLARSEPTVMTTTVTHTDGRIQVRESIVPALAPYARTTLTVPVAPVLLEPGAALTVETVLLPAGSKPMRVQTQVAVPGL